jgi:WD repeat-containing protein 61
MLAVSSQDSKVRIWNANSGVSVAVLDGGPMESWSLCWNPDTALNQLLSAGQSGQHITLARVIPKFSHVPQGKVSIWDLDSKTKVDSIDCGCKYVLCTRVAPEGGCVALSCQDGSVNLLDLATSKPRKRIEAHGKPARSLSFSADGKLLISASDDGTIVRVFTSAHNFSSFCS